MHSIHFTDEQLRTLLSSPAPDLALTTKAAAAMQSVYGNKVFIRGLIEFTNYCRKDCYYCGIRASQKSVIRYRMTSHQILDCCQLGYNLGIRTFVLQGGEDSRWDDDRLCRLVSRIRENYPDCAITLSVGERSRAGYRKLFDAGADRYLLRHETADSQHYKKLHPENLTLENRMRCLTDLKDIGYQVGCGFMVGTPGQTTEHLIRDLRFIEKLQPHMVGIGPFLPAMGTPFADEAAGSADLTIKLLSIVRLMNPKVLLPATTALATADRNGYERGVLAGANVIMPNLSPQEIRKKYILYDNKSSTGDDTVESVAHLRASMESIGYRIVTDRGDYVDHFNH